MTFKAYFTRVALVGVLMGSVIAGCDDSNDNDTPSDTAGKGGSGKGGSSGSSSKAGTGGSTSKAGSGGSSEAGESGGGSGGSGGSSDKAGSGGAGGSGGSGGSGMDECKGVDDCFCGDPDKNEDFLNQCTEATCNPYDNSKLTKIKDGKLPALP